MAVIVLRRFTTLVLLIVTGKCVYGNEMCKPVSFVELGKKGTVHCSIREPFYGVYWYNDTDLTKNSFIYNVNSAKGGIGYSTGEFDIYQNGSLIINNVSIDHEHAFAVVKLTSRQSKAITTNVDVVVTVHPAYPYPYVDQCNGSNYCFKRLHINATIRCTVTDARPSVSLVWIMETKDGPRNVSTESFVLKNMDVYTTTIKTKISHLDVNHFALLTCKAVEAQSLLKETESSLLAETKLFNSSLILPHLKNVTINEAIELPCSNHEVLFFVWKRKLPQANYEVIAHGSLGKRKTHYNVYRIGRLNSLILENFDSEQEGIYICFYGDGIDETWVAYNVSKIMHPSNDNSSTVIPEDLHLISYNIPIGVITTLAVLVVLILIGVFVYYKGKQCRRTELTETYQNLPTLNVLQDNGQQEKNVPDKPPREYYEETRDGHKEEFKPLLINDNGQQEKNVPDKPPREPNEETKDGHKEKFKPLLINDNEDNLSQEASGSDTLVKIQHCIGVENYAESLPICLSDVLRIRSSDLSNAEKVARENIISHFFKQTMSVDYKALTIFKNLVQSTTTGVSEKSDWLMILQTGKGKESRPDNEMETKHVSISCRDAIFVIFNSCDPFLRQKLVEKLSACHLAIPLILPQIDAPKATLLLWEISNLKKCWIENEDFHNEFVATYPFKAIGAVRFGGSKLSKSNVLNIMLGKEQGNTNHPFFISYQEDRVLSKYSQGTIEALWFLPKNRASQNKLMLNTVTLFLNFRGALSDEDTTPSEDFIFQFASCVISFVDISRYNAYQDKIKRMAEKVHLILVLTSSDSSAEHVVPNHESVYIINCCQCAESVIAEKVNTTLNCILAKNAIQGKSLSNSNQLCMRTGISTTLLNECVTAESNAKQITNIKSEAAIKEYTTRMFPLQKAWQDFTKLLKEQNLPQTMRMEQMQHQRKLQLSIELSKETKLFHSAIKQCSNNEFLYFVYWIQIYLSRKMLDVRKYMVSQSMLTSQSNTNDNEPTPPNDTLDMEQKDSSKMPHDERGLIQNKQQQLNDKLMRLRLGIEYLFRELGHLYECQREMAQKGTSSNISFLPGRMAYLLMKGFPLEIFDGETCTVPLRLIQDILKHVTDKIGDLRFSVMAMVGTAHSGKSKLLNAMFGTNFSTSNISNAHGVNIHLVTVDKSVKETLGYDCVIILDCKGIEYNDNFNFNKDFEMTNFVVCLSDLTLLNFQYESIGKEHSYMFKIIAASLVQKYKTSSSPYCKLIQHTTIDTNAVQDMINSDLALKHEFNTAVIEAAEKDGLSTNLQDYKDIIANKSDDLIYTIPSYSQTAMAPPSRDYIAAISRLKSNLLSLLKKDDNKEGLQLTHFGPLIENVWMDIANQNNQYE